MDYVNEYLKVSPFIAKQTKENEIAYERLMDVRLKLVDLSFEIDKNHDAYMRFMQQALNSPDLKMRIGKVGQLGEVSKGERIKRTVSVISSDPLCKDGNARFTTVPLKALSGLVWSSIENRKVN